MFRAMFCKIHYMYMHPLYQTENLMVIEQAGCGFIMLLRAINFIKLLKELQRHNEASWSSFMIVFIFACLRSTYRINPRSQHGEVVYGTRTAAASADSSINPTTPPSSSKRAKRLVRERPIVCTFIGLQQVIFVAYRQKQLLIDMISYALVWLWNLIGLLSC